MPTVQKRATSTTKATRRRDRVRDDDTGAVEDYEDEEETRPPRKSRTVRSRRERDTVAEPDEADDEAEDDEDDDDEETEARAPRRRLARVGKSRRDDDDDDEQGNGRRPRAPRAQTGVREGWEGAEETLKAGGGGDFLTPDKTIQLIKFLQDRPLLSCRQHWYDAESNTGQPMRRPVVCPGVDCPLCKMGDQPGPLYAFNVLKLSGSEPPKVQVLRLTTTGYQNLKEVSADRKTGQPVIDRDYYAVQKTGAGTNSARVVFRPVKERDLEDDWDEIFDQFDPDDLNDIIEDAQEQLFDKSIVRITTRKELERIAKYLNSQED